MGVIHVEDPDDDRLAEYRNVPDAQLVARRGLFIAEGRLVVRRLLVEGRLTARSLMVTGAAFAALEDVLATRQALPVYVVPQHVMNGIAGFNVHRGCLALGERPPRQRWNEAVAAASRLVVLLEGVGNADNVGAIFRHAAAFDVDAVLVGPSCADPLYRKAIRTSMGASLTMPFAEAEPWPGVLSGLREAGWMVIAMTPSADARPLREVGKKAAGRRIAVVLGHEGDGLTPAALTSCEHRARIPMARRVDSLNVAAAAAITLYELADAVAAPTCPP